MKIWKRTIFIFLITISCQSEGKICGTSINQLDSKNNNRFICNYLLLNKNWICVEDKCALISEIWLEDQWSCKGQDPPLNTMLKQLIVKFEKPLPNSYLLDYTILNIDPNLGNQIFYSRTKLLIATYVNGLPDTLTFCIYKREVQRNEPQIIDTLVFVKQDL